MNPLEIAYFYACAGLGLAGALAVVLAKNPIRGAMGLLLLILCVAGLFLSLQAQFLAAIQLIVYAGAIVILFLFVIMLLGPSSSTPNDGRGIVPRAFSGGLFVAASLLALFAVVRASMAAHRTIPIPNADASFGGIDAFGGVLFADALVPFELSSALLMVAVVGAVAVARGRQGAKTMSAGEREITDSPISPTPPAHPSGVFSHEIDQGAGGAAPATTERPA
jgi:NADH-quinone oxidoreductase subunit J